MFNSIILYTT